jgi:hypothetical protein
MPPKWTRQKVEMAGSFSKIVNAMKKSIGGIEKFTTRYRVNGEGVVQFSTIFDCNCLSNYNFVNGNDAVNGIVF